MLAKFSVRKPYTVIVAVILVLILGFISFSGMTTDLLPSIDLPYAVVMTSYTGATPEEVETVVTKPIEKTMATVSNIKTVSSQSSENYSLVVLEFYQDTNMDSVTQEMRENLDLIKSAWKDDNIGSPMIIKMNPDMMPVMISSVDMKGMDAKELSSFVDDTVLPAFERLEGVASVTAMGLSDEEIKVTIDEERVALVNKAISDSIDGNIAKAKSALSQARTQLNTASSQLEAEVSKNSSAIQEGESQIAAGKQQLDSSESALNNTLAELTAKKKSLTDQKNTLTAQKAEVDQKINEIEAANGTVPQALTEQKNSLAAALKEVNDGLAQVESGISQTEAGKTEIASQRKELNAKEAELQTGKATLDTEAAKAREQIAQGKSQVETQTKTLSSKAKEAKDNASIDDIITVEMISGILAAQNFSMPAGALSESSNGYTVKVGENVGSIEELKNLMLFELDIEGVDDVRLSDVADVTFAGSTDNSYTKVNGNDGILLMFQKQSGYSTSEVSDRINEEMAALEKANDGLSLTAFMDQGIYINMVTDSVLQNLIFGGILAILILFLFLRDIRPTVIVAVSIPASVLFAIVMMYFSGVTLNIISLSGLALGVGMLVDNSIIVIENIFRLRREGLSSKEAAVEGAKQVSGAIIASTLTTICVFFPIVFTDGISKQLFMDMGLTIAYSLIASLLVAMTLVPSMGARTLRKESKGEGKRFTAFKERYGKLLSWTLCHKAVVLIFVVVLLFASAVLSVIQGYSFMPESDSTEMSAVMTVEKGTSADELYDMAGTFMEKTMKIPEVKKVGAMDGTSLNSADIGMSTGGTPTSVSFYFLLDEKKDRTNKEIAKDMEAFAKNMNCQLDVTTSNMDLSMLGGSGIQVKVKGEDFDTLTKVTAELAAELKKTEGVAEATTSMEDANPELLISVDKDQAMKKGFTVAQVYASVSAAIDQGKTATTITMEGKDYPVIVVDGKAETMTENEIENITINSTTTQAAMGSSTKNNDEDVTVGEIATVTEKQSPSTITREGQVRYMTVSATAEKDANIGLVGQNVKKVLEKYDAPKGYTIEMQGESVTVEKSIVDLLKVILLALVLTYLIMVAQFQSLRAPFIVMFTVPLAFTGGFLALLLTSLDVSVIALLGFLILTGVVVNNGIVLVDYTDQLRAGGMELREAVILGGKTRIRPVLMTASTTVLGLTTMAMGLGTGGEMVQPMAVVCIGGLTYATIMTLFVVPVMYEITHSKRKKKAVKKEEGEAEE